MSGVYVFVFVYIHTHIHTYIATYIHIHIYIHIYIYIHTYIYIYTYIIYNISKLKKTYIIYRNSSKALTVSALLLLGCRSTQCVLFQAHTAAGNPRAISFVPVLPFEQQPGGISTCDSKVENTCTWLTVSNMYMQFTVANIHMRFEGSKHVHAAHYACSLQ